MSVVRREFESADAMADALAGEIAARLGAAVEARGRASLVCAGGTTPGDLYVRLAVAPIPWDHVDVTLSDERWLAPSDAASNARLLRETLLQGPAAAARFVPLKTAAASPEAAQAEVDDALAAMARPFDVVLLGMGDDLHTASLFPGAEGVGAALDTASPALVRAVRAPGAAGSPLRLSLTARALLDARQIVLLLRGEAKRASLARALAPGAVAEAPVRAILHGAAPVDVCWAP